MSLMLDFYGLREHPFGVSPNPRFLYPSVQHREALASLIFGIEYEGGFTALIAEPGVGKTTLLFDLLLRYRERASTAFIFNTQCSGQELLRLIAKDLNIPGGESEQDPVRLHLMFRSFVADHTRTKPVVIIIDEAHNLENSALEAIRLLSNFEAADHKLTHIILAGQPLLGKKLRSANQTQLLQRITTITRLERFSPSQVEECIAYRLQIAGYAGSPLFATEATAKIGTASGGVPREINRICSNALQLGFVRRQRQIGAEVIEEVLQDLILSCDPQTEASTGVDESEPQFRGIEPKATNAPVELSLGDQVIEAYRSGLNLHRTSNAPVEPIVSRTPPEMPAEAPCKTAPAEFSLGNQVIEACLSNLDLKCISSIPVEPVVTEMQPEIPADISPEAQRNATPADLNLGDQVIEACLPKPNLSRDSGTAASNELHGPEPRLSGIEAVSSRIAVDPRVAKILAPKPAKITVGPKDSNLHEEPGVTEIPGNKGTQALAQPASQSSAAPPLATTKPLPKWLRWLE